MVSMMYGYSTVPVHSAQTRARCDNSHTSAGYVVMETWGAASNRLTTGHAKSVQYYATCGK